MKAAIYLNCGLPFAPPEPADFVICCDGAYYSCPVRPDLFVGDGDSAGGFPSDVPVLSHDSHKNFTDGESAVYFAREKGADEIVFYGVTGGRYDHTLGNLAVMHLALDLGMRCKAVEGDCVIHGLSAALTPLFELETGRGVTFSVVPHGGSAVITDAKGTEYPLDDLTLTPADTRGISNVSAAESVSLRVVRGTAFLIVDAHA